jgi:hypothetical protein
VSSEVGCSIICVVCGTSRFTKRIIDIAYHVFIKFLGAPLLHKIRCLV